MTTTICTEQQEQVLRALRGPQFNRNHSGSLYSRGGADSYYGRGVRPHWLCNGARVTDLTPAEREEYYAGYDANEASGDKKDWN